MPDKPALARYSRMQIVLHWITVVLILFQYVFPDAIARAFGRMMGGAAAPDSIDPMVPAHIFAGVAILLLTLWRLALRLRHGVPALPAANSALLRRAAHLGHVAPYALLLLVPVSGAVAWFGAIGPAAGAHLLLKTLLMVMVLGHAGFAIYHHVVLRDGLLNRMRIGG